MLGGNDCLYIVLDGVDISQRRENIGFDVGVERSQPEYMRFDWFEDRELLQVKGNLGLDFCRSNRQFIRLILNN